MTDGGKPGNPKPGFPLFPPYLEIADAIPTFPQVLLCPYNHEGTQNRIRKLVTHVLG
jgi:hypothetical protein